MDSERLTRGRSANVDTDGGYTDPRPRFVRRLAITKMFADPLSASVLVC